MTKALLSREEIKAKILLLTEEIRHWQRQGSPRDAEHATQVRDELLEQLHDMAER